MTDLPTCDTERMKALISNADISDPALSSTLSIFLRTSQPDMDLFWVMAESPLVDCRAAAAQHQSCPAEILSMLARDSSPQVASHVAYNLAAPSELMISLSEHPSLIVRSYVASNPNTPTSVLEEFLKSPLEIRLRMACNPALTTALFNALVQDRNPNVRARAIGNDACPRDILHRADSDCFDVKQHLIRNSAAPCLVLARLAFTSKSPHLSEKALYALKSRPMSNWFIDFNEGVTLDSHIGKTIRSKVFGECLLSSGHIELYQKVQSYYLQYKISREANQHATNTVHSHRTTKHRM